MNLDLKKFMSEHFDFDGINIWELFCTMDQGILMTDENGVIGNTNVGNTIHSVFPLYKEGMVISTIRLLNKEKL